LKESNGEPFDENPRASLTKHTKTSALKYHRKQKKEEIKEREEGGRWKKEEEKEKEKEKEKERERR